MNVQQKVASGQDEAVTATHTSPTLDPPSAVAIFVVATCLLLAGYTLVFAVTLPATVFRSFAVAASNVIPLALLSAVTYFGLRRWVLPSGVLFQASCHLLLAPCFAMLWYGLIVVAQAILAVRERGSIELLSFSPIALVWQVFQGLVLYALVAAITYALRGGRLAAPVRLVSLREPIERYLTKQGDELIPVEVEDIVCIRGAQDYAEVATIGGRSHLIRLSLGELEQRLPHNQFLRVHRSAIVNLRHLGRAEPVGSGRMALHLAGGQTVETSRNGAQMIRLRVI